MTQKFIITSEYGLHARPATRLVNQAMTYHSEITLTAFDRTVNLKSIMGDELSVYHGETIEITAKVSMKKKLLLVYQILWLRRIRKGRQ